MSKLEELKNKAKDLVTENRDKIEDGLEKAGKFVDEKTGGKHSDKIDKGLDKVNQGLDRAEGKESEGDTDVNLATGPAEPPQPTVPATEPGTNPPAGPLMG